MKTATAVLDADGTIAITGAGKGGGGAWCLRPHISEGKPAVDLPWLAKYLNSAEVWTWLKSEGDAKDGGWKGVDKSVLVRLPVHLDSGP
jgi:hypothetical protein